MPKLTVIGIYGSTLDAGGKRRWERWRPTASLFQHADRVVHRLELLVAPRYQRAARTLIADIERLSPETEVVSIPFALDDPWDFEEVYSALLDFARAREPDPEEELLVHITTGTHVAQICLFLLTEAHYLRGRLLQSSPPRGSDEPGWDEIDLDLSRYDRIAQRFATERQQGTELLKQGIQTASPVYNALIERIERVSLLSTEPILLSGPTGAGKSRLARLITELRRQRGLLDGPLVEVNCATLRGDTAMAALFGHRRGAFTDAGDRPGLLLAAHGGVLFLDEVGELGLDEQAMLLGAIEQKRFLPMGCDTEVHSDFQLICGSNRDLAQRVSQGKFREDLLARIDLWRFDLPGLAERPEDIPPNLDYELALFARLHSRHISFNRAARERFLAFATDPSSAWSGNFRDLNAAVVRMATLAPGGRITAQQVQAEIGRLRTRWAPASRADASTELLGEVELDRFDRVQLNEVIAVCRSSRSLSAAGRALFAVSRAKRTSVNDADRLRKYLARFGLDWDRVRG